MYIIDLENKHNFQIITYIISGIAGVIYSPAFDYCDDL